MTGPQTAAAAAIDTARIRSWLADQALALWATRGRDGPHGFVEQLALDGTPILECAKRMRVQARQAYVYAHASVLGWPGPPGGPTALDVAAGAIGFLANHYWHDNGGWIFSASRTGAPVEQRRESYELAFALLALVWYVRAGGNAHDWIERTLAFADEHLADQTHGGLREGVPDTGPRRQNPHMHLLEALLALHAATDDDGYLNRARTIVALFRERLFDAATGTLGEYFTADWQPVPGVDGTIVEPGHHFEWLWLLDRYGGATGDDTTAEQDALYAFAEAHGIDPADGLAWDAVRRDGTVHDTNKRLWVQTEAIKAQLVRLERGDDERAAARLATLLERMFERYLGGTANCAAGAWQDHLRADGTGFAVAAPASSLYHLFVAFTEVLRVVDGEPVRL